MARWLLTLGWMIPALVGCSRTADAPQAPEPETRQSNLQRCAATFAEVYVEHRDHEQADTLLWNAGSCHAEAGDRTEAALVFDLLISRFPDSKHVEPARQVLRELYVLEDERPAVTPAG